MKKTRVLAWAVAAAMALSLAACGGSGGGATTAAPTTAAPATTTAAPATTAAATTTAAPAAEAPMNISVAVWDVEKGFPEDGSVDPMKKFFYDKFNIVMEPMNITWGDARERYQIWASSDTMPDICGGLDIVGGGMYFTWVKDGVVAPLPKDLSAYPNVKQFVDLPETQAYKVGDTNYFLPRITYENVAWWAMDRGVYFRKDWMENLKLDYPKSTDEFIEMCIAFTFKDPDGNGVDDTFGMTRSEINIWSQNFANFGYHERFWQKIDGVWTQPDTTARVIPLVDMARRINKAGALDPDFITYTSAAPGDSMFCQGRAGVLLKQNTPGSVNGLRDQWLEFQPDIEFLEAVEFLKFWDEPGMDTYRFSERSFWSESYVGSQVDDKKMDRILQIYDWMYSKEGVMFMLYGFEGEDYKVDAKGEVEILLPLIESGAIQPLNQKYPFARLASLACWCGSRMMYENVRIPRSVREFCAIERDFRIANWKDPEVSWVVGGIDVPEKQETTHNTGELWTVIMMDGSDTPTKDLYESYMVPELEAGGYFRMRDAVNAKAKEMGL